MSTSITVSEARAALPQIVERVLAGEEVTLTRHGVAVAVVVHPDALKVRRAAGSLAAVDELRDAIAAGRRRPLGVKPKLSRSRAAALEADVRAARSRR